jgi:hypothetical protein
MHMGSNERGAYYDKTGKGQRYLSDAVVDAQKNWPTPAVMDTMGGPYKTEFVDGVFRSYHNHSKENAPQYGARLRDAVTCGLPAPANPSTHGSRQESLDQSQRNWQTFAHGTHNRGETPHRQVVKALVNEEKAQTQCLTVDQVFAEEIKGTSRPEMWRTPSVAEEKNQNTSTQIYLQNQVGATPKAWATPKASDPQHSGPNMRDSAGNYALPAQVTKSWLTPKVPSGGSQAERTTAGGGLRKLEDQTQTPTGKLNSQWVTQLMGLSLGWVSPSCPASVIKNWPRFVSGWSALTIAPMSCDSSAMESCRPLQSELSEFSLAS